VMQKKVFFSIIVLVLLSSALFQSVTITQAQSTNPSRQNGFQVFESSAERLVVQLSLPEFEWVMLQSNQGECLQIQLPGWGLSGDFGGPALPVKGTLVGIPPGANPKVNVLQTGNVREYTGVNLCPAATPVQSEFSENLFPDFEEQWIVDPAAYSLNLDFPGQLTSLGEPALIRSQSVMPLLFQPFQYNPLEKHLTVYSTLTVQVDFGNQPDRQLITTPIDEGYFEDILQNQVINYGDARDWRTANPQLEAAQADTPIWPACKLSVSQDGMIQVTYGELTEKCLLIANSDPRNFQLWNGDQEVAIMIPGEADGVFESGETLLFYGQKNTTRFTNTNVYWLVAGENAGQRMAQSDGMPDTGTNPLSFVSNVHREENKIYLSAFPSGLDQNRLYWALVQPSAPGNYQIYLKHINPSAATAKIRGFFKSYAANPQHFTRVILNGNMISEAFWPKQGEFNLDMEVPVSYLLEGPNTIEVQSPLEGGVSVNQVLVDWFEVEYAKNYAADGAQTLFAVDAAGTWKFEVPGFSSAELLTWDITNPNQPASIANTNIEENESAYNLTFQQTTTEPRQYLTALLANIPTPDEVQWVADPGLKSQSNGADYIIISHPLFTPALGPLVDFYTNRGLRVNVVNVFDIYNEFSQGVFTPDAIRDFLAYSYNNWARPAPAYVLLVGDGNLDFKNFYGRNDPVFIPPYLANVDPWILETAADNRFVTISGADILPDMALGRLPVTTLAEAQAAIAKILAHYQYSSEEWFTQQLYVAAAIDPAAGNFPALSDAVINNFLPGTVQADRVYYGQNGITSGALAQQAIKEAINSGRGLVHFVGHSNPYSWFGNPNIPNALGTVMLDYLNISGYSNLDKYPIVLPMTCYTGYYTLPGIDVLDEVLIRAAGKGAVATWSPTGKGVATGHNLLDAGFYTAVYQEHVTTLGAATNAAKYYLYANSGGLHRELIDTYVLFGDPAMLFQNKPTSVEVISFQAKEAVAGVQLSWETADETTLSGFNLYRREIPGDFVRVNAVLIEAKTSGQLTGSSYTYLDEEASPAIVYEYRLDAIENSLQNLLSKFVTYTPLRIYLPVLVR